MNDVLDSSTIRSKWELEGDVGGRNFFRQRLESKNNEKIINELTKDTMIACIKYLMRLNTRKNSASESEAVNTAVRLHNYFEKIGIDSILEYNNKTDHPDNEINRAILLEAFKIFACECVNIEEVDITAINKTIAERLPEITNRLINNSFQKERNSPNQPASPSFIEKIYNSNMLKLDPESALSISTPIPTPCEFFCGRDNEIKEIKNILSESGYAILKGIGGIGKSETAKWYIKQYKSEYNKILWLSFSKDIRTTLSGTYFPEDAMNPNDTIENAYQRKLARINNLPGRILVVIDNCNILPEDDDELFNFVNYSFDVIITSRSLNDNTTINIEPIADIQILLALFKLHCPKYKDEKNDIALSVLITSLNGHTLLLELYAKLLQRSNMTLEKAIAHAQHQASFSNDTSIRIKKDNKVSSTNLAAHISQLFQLDELSSVYTKGMEIYLTACSMIPDCGLFTSDLKMLSGIDDYNIIYKINDLGWIRIDNDIVFIHPLIRSALLNHYANSNQCSNILNNMTIFTDVNVLFKNQISTEQRNCRNAMLNYVFSTLFSENIEWLCLCKKVFDYLSESPNLANTIQTYDKIRSTIESTALKDSIYHSNIQIVIANIYQKMGNRVSAMSLIDEAISIIEANKNCTDKNYSIIRDDAYIMKAQFYVDAGNYADAQNIFEKEITTERAEHDSTYADILFYIDREKELVVRRNILLDNIVSFGEKSSQTAKAHSDLAVSYSKQKDSRYIEHHEMSISILEEIGLENDYSYANASFAYAVSLLDMNQPQKALPLIEHALPIFIENISDSPESVANIEYLYGECFRQLNDNKQACEHFINSTNMFEILLGEYISANAKVANIYHTIASLLVETDFEESALYLKKCVDIIINLRDETTLYFEKHRALFALCVSNIQLKNIDEYTKAYQLLHDYFEENGNTAIYEHSLYEVSLAAITMNNGYDDLSIINADRACQLLIKNETLLKGYGKQAYYDNRKQAIFIFYTAAFNCDYSSHIEDYISYAEHDFGPSPELNSIYMLAGCTLSNIQMFDVAIKYLSLYEQNVDLYKSSNVAEVRYVIKAFINYYQYKQLPDYEKKYSKLLELYPY